MAADISSAFADLTEKQQIFCEHVLRGVPKKAAAKTAGYTGEQECYRLSKLPVIQEALIKARQITANACARDREFMDKKLEEAWHNSATAAEQVMVVREWKKLHGLDAPTKVEHKHDHAGEITHVAELRDMSTDDLRRLIATGEAAPKQLPVLEGEFVDA